MQAAEDYDEERWYQPTGQYNVTYSIPIDEPKDAVLTFTMQRFVDLFQTPIERALRMHAQMQEIDALWAPYGQVLMGQFMKLGQNYEYERATHMSDFMEWYWAMRAAHRRPWWKFWMPWRRGRMRDNWSPQSIELVDLAIDRYDHDGRPKDRRSGSMTAIRSYFDILRIFPDQAYAGKATWNDLQGMVEVCQRELHRYPSGSDSVEPTITFDARWAVFSNDEATMLRAANVDAMYQHRTLMSQVSERLRATMEATFKSMHAGWLPKRIDLGKYVTDIHYVVPESDPIHTVLNIFSRSLEEIFHDLLPNRSTAQPPVQSE